MPRNALSRQDFTDKSHWLSETKILKSYRRYLESVEKRGLAELDELLRHIEVMVRRPKFFVLVEGTDDDQRVHTIESCEKQIYPPTRVLKSREEAASLENENSYLMMLEAGDRLHWRALYEFASLLNAEPQLDLIYSDEDVIDENGERIQPFFKPDWSPDYYETTDYVGTSACYRLSLIKDLLPASTNGFDFGLRFTEKTNAIGHIKRILLHRVNSILDRPKSATVDSDQEAISKRLERTGRIGTVQQVAIDARSYRLTTRLQVHPKISIVIPTAGAIKDVDGQRQRDLIAACINSIVTKSTYPDYEIIVVHNDDFDRKRLLTIRDIPLRCITYSEREVNVAKKLNLGAAWAAGEMLLLLNDDTEVITGDWLELMLAHFAKPHVGVVGPKLLYPNMTIQHAGVVSEKGQPIHVSRGVDRNDPGYFFSNATTRDYLAVTGAVMMTKAKHYQEVGGYDEELPLYYNDIDFCYKMHVSGWSNVYEPGAELIHFESLSWTASDRDEHRGIFWDRWGHLTIDPFYDGHVMDFGRPDFQFVDSARAV